MGVMDKFLGTMRLNMPEEDEYDDYDEDEIYDEPKEKKALFSKKKASYDIDEDDDYEEPVQEKSRKSSARSNSKVVPMKMNGRHSEVCMVMPRADEDANQVADLLLQGKAVVLNLEGMNVDSAQRIIDFASGACYTMGGNLQKISKKIFIVTPNTVELSGDFSDLLGGENIDLGSLNLNQ